MLEHVSTSVFIPSTYSSVWVSHTIFIHHLMNISVIFYLVGSMSNTKEKISTNFLCG